MTLLTLILFIPACFALNMIPGPNNLLSMSNAQRYGFQYALIAGVARLVAFVVLIALAGTGFATLLYMLPSLFLVIKVVGAIYIFWIAYQLWCAEVADIDEHGKNQKSLVQLAKQEFLLAVGNPKAILVFTAFFPHFINPAENTTVQFALLGAVFLALELTAIAIYACFGLYLRRWFSQPMMRKWFNRGCAAFLGFLGLGLLLERSH
jgi:threonine/homoserine/homoserine lactone efflux protein